MILLAVYIYFRLGKWCQTKSKFKRFSYLSSKWVTKQWRQLTTSAMHLAQELLTNVQCSDGSRSFAKEMRALKIRSTGANYQKLTTTNWEPSSKPILLQLHEKLLKNSMSTILWSCSIWSKLERWKSLINGCLMSWPKVKKNCCCKVLSFFILSNNKQFLYPIVMCDIMWILYDNQLSGWTKKKLQSSSQRQLAPKEKKKKKGHCHTQFSGLLPIWSTTIFWILVNPLHLRIMFSKLVRCSENCSACSCHQSTERAQFFSTTTSDFTSYNQRFKNWTHSAKKFCLIHHIHLTSSQLTTPSSSILTAVCRNTSWRQKMLSKSS